MNRQRKVLITTTYNEMGIIIDTKAEEVAQPDLQPTCNQLATDCISRQAAIDALREEFKKHPTIAIRAMQAVRILPSAQPDRSLWFRIGEVCVGESKGNITAEVAIEKIRALLRAERREE